MPDAVAMSRAAQSRGTSAPEIYRAVGTLLEARNVSGGVVVDVGCGGGALWPLVRRRFRRYVGVDIVRYPEFDASVTFVQSDLNTDAICLPDGFADLVVAVETIEHLENPRKFMRELSRLTKPGGVVVVTTPNQLSLLSILTLLFRQRFAAFQDCDYPAHISAVLPCDLVRMAAECGLMDTTVEFTGVGRIPGLARHFPRSISGLFRRFLSDNVLMMAVRDPRG